MFPERGEIKEGRYEDIRNPMLRDDLKMLADKLRPITEERRIPMKLSIFKRKWLAMFIGKVDPKDQPHGFPVTKWINEVTTNPYTWVDVIDAQGEIVYSIPPLLNSNAVKIQHVDFYHHIMELQAMRDHSATPAEIEEYRKKHILNLISRDEEADRYIQEINKIAMYHGYAPFTNVVEKGEDDSMAEPSPSEKIRVDDF